MFYCSLYVLFSSNQLRLGTSCEEKSIELDRHGKCHVGYTYAITLLLDM